MPHFVVEYTENIKATARIPELLKKAIQIQAGLTWICHPGLSMPPAMAKMRLAPIM